MTRYGPGDPETWPAPTGHPNDPRTVDSRCPDCDGPLDYLDGCPACGWYDEPDYEQMLA